MCPGGRDRSSIQRYCRGVLCCPRQRRRLARKHSGGIGVRFATGAGGPVTVIVLADCAGDVPVAPVATSVYVVVVRGFTCIDPVAVTGFPFKVTVVAFCVCQVSVAVCPDFMLVMSDVSVADGAGTGTALKPPQLVSVVIKKTIKAIAICITRRFRMARSTSERSKWRIG